MWIVAVFLTSIAMNWGIATGAEEWSYDHETKWPGKCREGRQQSPINILTRDAILDKKQVHIKGPLKFQGYGKVNASANNDGHTLNWRAVEKEPKPILSGGPLKGNYSFVQFHLHWLSEHAIDGMKYPLEIHMVHRKTGLTNEEALKQPDGFAAIGILAQVHKGEESEFALGKIAPVIPKLSKRSKGSSPASIIDLRRLFSPNMQSYYTYHGSVTTPQCQEAVTWIVMDKPINISDTQYKLLSKVDIGGIHNYRSLQPVNRVIYRSVASRTSVALPSVGNLTTFINQSASISKIVSKGVCTVVNIKSEYLGDNVVQCEKPV